MNIVETPQTRCRAAIARCDITPPSGIYHRMWGAATHERATGVHRPLMANLLWLEPTSGDAASALVVAVLDHCLFDASEVGQFKASIAAAAEISDEQVQVCVTHTHATGLMSRSRGTSPGGELIGPYLDDVAHRLAELASAAKAARVPASIVYGQGRCNLAANRDYFDAESNQTVCGYNPTGPADDSVLVAKIIADSGQTLGTIVNYACHPTTLAWQNTLISPDYVGALRETIEREMQVPCIFLQGASADLGPREGFVGDVTVADRNGRQLGFATLSALAALPAPGTEFRYAGAVTSGATIGTWEHRAASAGKQEGQARWSIVRSFAELAYRADLPTIDQACAELATWQAKEAACDCASLPQQAREYHARVEQAQRQLWRLESLPRPTFPLPYTIARLGDGLWLFVAGEHYQTLQTSLRGRFPKNPLLINTIANGWQPGYMPPADVYGRGIYQEQIAVVAPGSAEQLLTAITNEITAMLG